jgi:hypothetical protein
MEISRALTIVRAMGIAAAGVEQTEITHVDSLVRTVLGVAAGSAADLPTMPRDLSRLMLRTEELESDVSDGGPLLWPDGHSFVVSPAHALTW